MSPFSLKDKYKTPDYQLFLATGGFGCSPTARGRKVFGSFLKDGETAQFQRSDFIGVIKDEYLPEWAVEKLQELSQPEEGTSEGMRNGTMFAGLRGYREQAFCKNHPIIEFETADECGIFSVFAVMTVNTDNSWYRFVDTETPEEYARYIEKAKAASLYDTGITPEYGEQILTLSTCTGLARDNRLLVLAVKKSIKSSRFAGEGTADFLSFFHSKA